jgi:glycosyltransferase involved in cell wall biosynthesis
MPPAHRDSDREAIAQQFRKRCYRGIACDWANRLLLSPQIRGARYNYQPFIRHILAQEHIDLEVIPVSDRGRDRTDCILGQLALEDSRVHPKRVNVLPERWLGKCYACHVGASSATGDWTLFTDADCWLKPDVIARAIAIAEREDVDHVTLTPGVAPQTLAAEGWHIAFLISLADWFARVNQDKPNGHLGIGAFNLIRFP